MDTIICPRYVSCDNINTRFTTEGIVSILCNIMCDIINGFVGLECIIPILEFDQTVCVYYSGLITYHQPYHQAHVLAEPTP